jgi:hypothetical protein
VNSDARRYVPFFVALVAIVVIALLSFGAGYRLGVATHRVTHTVPATRP